MRFLTSTALAAVLLLSPPIAAGAQGAVADSAISIEAGASARAATGRLRPGDRVTLRVWREPDLSNDALIVDDRLEVAIPRIGLVSVAEHTPSSLREWLRGQYATFLRDPVVDIAVLRRVVVNGEVNRPGIYYVDITTTLRDVIAQAGGIGGGGSWSRVTIVRGDERIPVRDWARADAQAANLSSGDQVIVGRRSWVGQNFLGLVGTGLAVISFAISLRNR